jgi:hypothetical protein
LKPFLQCQAGYSIYTRALLNNPMHFDVISRP